MWPALPPCLHGRININTSDNKPNSKAQDLPKKIYDIVSRSKMSQFSLQFKGLSRQNKESYIHAPFTHWQRLPSELHVLPMYIIATIETWVAFEHFPYEADYVQADYMDEKGKTHGEKRKAYRILGTKPEGKRPSDTPRSTWNNNINIDTAEIWSGYKCLRMEYKVVAAMNTRLTIK